jgi:carboxyl-terminal processing protease
MDQNIPTNISKKWHLKKSYIAIGILVALGIGFAGGLSYKTKVINTSRGPALPADQEVTEDQIAPFWDAWRVLSTRFVTAASTTDQEKIYGAIQGLASSFGDPYTVFFPPVQSKKFQDDLSGNFSGVGMEIGMKNGQLTVVAPLKDSPAERAGVKAGDFILMIDGTSTASMSVDEAVSNIRGPKGTAVKINFLPKDSTKPIDRTIIRDIIKIPTLDTLTKPGGIFVIKLYSFTSQSPELFRNALRDFISSGSHKLIIDLRGNPGGYLDAAWDMASYFLPIGKTVVTEDFGANGSPSVFRSKGFNIFNDNLKLLILVDGGSASASEILAGALQDNKVAKLVGIKTFGKGSVQELVSITPDTSLKVTIARWLTPKGHNLSHDGLEPDYPVSVADKDIAASRDPIMDKAVEILTAMP